MWKQTFLCNKLPFPTPGYHKSALHKNITAPSTRSLHGKVRIIANSREALIYYHVVIQLIYPLPGIAHKCEVKTLVSRVLHTGKFRLETWNYSIWAWNVIGGAEVERAAIPLPVDIYDVVELRILRRRLDVFRLQFRLDERVGFGRHFCFQRHWHWRRRRFAWTVDPAFLWFWHMTFLR